MCSTFPSLSEANIGEVNEGGSVDLRRYLRKKDKFASNKSVEKSTCVIERSMIEGYPWIFDVKEDELVRQM